MAQETTTSPQTNPVEPAAPEAPIPSETPEKPPSLDEIYAKYNQTPPAAPQPQQPYVPQYAAQNQTVTDDSVEPTAAELKRELETLKRSLDEERGLNAKERQQIATETQQRDLNDAIDKLAEKVDVPNKKLIKYALADVWENNPAFQKIWEARRDNPKMFAEALARLVPTVQSALEVKSDSDLLQKQMAMDHATKGIESEPMEPKTEGERLASMNDGQFQKFWYGESWS